MVSLTQTAQGAPHQVRGSHFTPETPASFFQEGGTGDGMPFPQRVGYLAFGPGWFRFLKSSIWRIQSGWGEKESDLVRGVFLREKTAIAVGRAEHYAPWGNTGVAWSSVWGGHLHRRFTVGTPPFLSSTHQLSPWECSFVPPQESKWL